MKQSYDIVSYAFTFVWYCIAIALVSGALYIFLIGSSVFPWNRDRIAARIHVEQQGGKTFVTGSVTPLNACARVSLAQSDVPGRIALESKEAQVCDAATEDHRPVTFVAEIDAIDAESISVTYDGRPIPITLQ